MVISLKYPAPPGAAPSETIMAEEEFTPLMIMLFFTVTFVIGVKPVDPTTMTCGVVVDVFEIVRSRVVPAAVFDPSIIVLGLRILRICALGEDPEMEAVTPVFGLMVNVFTALDPGFGFITIGKVSVAELYVDNSSNVTGQVISLLLISAIAVVRSA